MIILFFTGTERLNNFPKVTLPVSGGKRIWIQTTSLYLVAMSLNITPLSPLKTGKQQINLAIDALHVLIYVIFPTTLWSRNNFYVLLHVLYM